MGPWEWSSQSMSPTACGASLPVSEGASAAVSARRSACTASNSTGTSSTRSPPSADTRTAAARAIARANAVRKCLVSQGLRTAPARKCDLQKSRAARHRRERIVRMSAASASSRAGSASTGANALTSSPAGPAIASTAPRSGTMVIGSVHDDAPSESTHPPHQIGELPPSLDRLAAVVPMLPRMAVAGRTAAQLPAVHPAPAIRHRRGLAWRPSPRPCTAPRGRLHGIDARRSGHPLPPGCSTAPTIACPPSFTVTCSTRTVCCPDFPRWRFNASISAALVRLSRFA